MENLNKEIRKCKRCPLWRKRRNTVPGEGPINAKTMVIAQAPGAEEDKTGRPFIGRAGKLLTELFKIAGIKREEVFITNPVKCFPPKNRKPTEKEIKACSSFFQRQIKIINPRRFILLGSVAFKMFFPDKKLKDWRGKLIKKDGKQFFIVYHPAAGIRFQKNKKILEKDFRKLRKL